MKSANKIYLLLVLCLALVLLAMGVSFPQMTRAVGYNGYMESNAYLLDKVIEWSDGSTEHIQIGDDGFFVLDGVKKRLVGMFVTLCWMPHGDSCQFFLPENMALLDKEFTYLESVGIRLIHFPLWYVRWWLPETIDEERVLTDVLDLAYSHKMLVIPLIMGRDLPNFGNLVESDFSWPVYGSQHTDSMGEWVGRWAEYISRYPNVVGVVLDNELDLPMKAGQHPAVTEDQKYTPAAVENFLNYLRSIIRSKVKVPVVHKLTCWRSDKPEVKQACLRATDFPCFDCYAKTTVQLDARITELMQWVGELGFPTTGWWCLELGSGVGWNIDAGNLNTGYIESVFVHGASVAALFCDYCSLIPAASLFDMNGNPVPKLVEIAQEIERLQAPILE